MNRLERLGVGVAFAVSASACGESLPPHQQQAVDAVNRQATEFAEEVGSKEIAETIELYMFYVNNPSSK